MRPYLEGYEFKVITDHLSLKWLNSIDNPTGRLARWALELQQYKFSIDYRKGKQNIVADALSRHPVAVINLAQVRSINACPWYDGKVEAVRRNPESHADYTLFDNQLYRHFSREVNDEDSTPWKLCVPRHQRQRVLKETHDEVTGGHMGMRKTLNKIASRYYWPGLARDVQRYVRQCEICQKYKVSQQQPAGKMLSRIPDEPWSVLCADFIGPLPRTAHGNTMLLVLFDNFSKWVELIPCRKATAEGVVKAIRERIVSRYGVPKVLITDNGTQFTSRILKRYLEHVGVKQQFTAPYTPQENPTERANRTIKTTIAQFSGERHNRWDEFLPEVMLAINTSVSESTGYSPAFLTQGRIPRLPKALYDDVTIGSGGRRTHPEERAVELQEIIKIVRNNLEKATQKQRQHYNLRRRHWAPKIGDHVLLRQHTLSKAVDNFTAKLAPKFKGPYVVVDFLSPVIVRVRATEHNEQFNAHVSELKPYHANDHSLFFISSRLIKTRSGRDAEDMEASRDKFERTKEKFRRHMQQQQQNVRRTIFLADDDVPCCSKNQHPSNRRTTYRDAPGPSKQNVRSKEKCFRMTATTPSGPEKSDGNVSTKESKMAQPEPMPYPHGVINSNDDETPPPPPKWEEACSTTHVDQCPEKPDETPLSSIWEDNIFDLCDLEIGSEDLDEFCQTLWDIPDTAMERRPPTPPSPPASSSSSLDWESENFRPPTPPKRRGFINVEVHERSYPYLGMQCYELLWRGQMLLPKMKFTPEISTYAHPLGEQSEPPWPKFSPDGSSSRGHTYQDTPATQYTVTPTASNTYNTSPIPQPPPLFSSSVEIPEVSEIPPPPPIAIPSPTRSSGHQPKLHDCLTLEQLPFEIREEIENARQRNQGKRYRFKKRIWGHEYRVNISRSGEVQIKHT